MDYEWITFPQNTYELHDKNTNEKLFQPHLLNSLINNLLSQGMYFPFFSNAENKVFLGRHRFYGLMQQNDKINKKFLVIKECKNYSINKILTYKIFNKQFLYKTYAKPIDAIRHGLYLLSDFLGRHLTESNNYHSDYFFPNPIFQTEKAFHDFITNPWEDYEKNIMN